MSRPNYTTLIFRGWFSLLMFSLLGLVLALAVSFVQPLKYSSTARLLILQDVGLSVDAYTASRSEERIAENLSTIVYTTTFFEQVLNSGYSIDEHTFPIDDAKRRRAWSRTIATTVSRGSGLLTITAFHPDVRQAEQIVRASAFVLTQNVRDYTSGSNISVRLIDAPLNSRWPVKPNVPANMVSGFVLGSLMGVAYVMAQNERLRRRHQLVLEDN